MSKHVEACRSMSKHVLRSMRECMVIRSEDTFSQLEVRPCAVGSTVVAFAIGAAGPHAHCSLDEVAFYRSEVRRFCDEVAHLLESPVGSVTLRAKTPGEAELHLSRVGWATQRLALRVELGWGRPMHGPT